MENILDLIRAERKRQDEKFGVQNWPKSVYLTILMEEVGEVARAILEKDDEQYAKELTHCAAVCVAMLQSFENAN